MRASHSAECAGVVAQPALEVRRGEHANVGEDHVEVREREPRQDLIGLVLDHELERGVLARGDGPRW